MSLLNPSEPAARVRRSGLIVTPRPGARRDGRVPTADEYVADYLTTMRAPLKQRTTFTQAGRSVQHSPGELVIYAPDGSAIRIVELPEGGNQIEHGDRLHAVVRPNVVTLNPHTS